MTACFACRYVNPKFPVHFIVGGAGCDEMKGDQVTGTESSNVTATASNPAWMADADTTHYGMGVLDVVNVSALVLLSG